MRKSKEEQRLLWTILALAILLLLAYFLYTVVTSEEAGINLMDQNVVQNRVADRYLHKNVLDETSTYVWGGKAEDSAANIVTAVIADYRLFDTALEVIVLFVTVMGFGLVLPEGNRKIKPSTHLFYTWMPILMTFMLLVGGYLFVNGHLSPGGGFPAGAIMSTAVLVGVFAGQKTLSKHSLKVIEAIAGVAIFSLAIVGYLKDGVFFINFLEGGNIGEVFSAGLIPILYTLVAFKVSAELSGVYLEFYKGGDEYEHA